jgi:SAM-dependent methyltransferase
MTGVGGRRRAGAVDYDAELGLYDDVLRSAWGVGPGDHVVDIGCGAGRTTRQAARLAVGGSALGIDVSADAVARARELAREDGLRNISFECADAQVRRFPDGRFDLAISRFGTMFFGDPVAAFSNIGRALRPTGRLVMMVWRAEEHNEWAVAIDRILGADDRTAAVDPTAPDPTAPDPTALDLAASDLAAPDLAAPDLTALDLAASDLAAPDLTAPDAAAPDAFSLGDPTTATAILRAAGFVDVTFTDVDRPVFYGLDVDTALAWIRGFSTTRKALERLDPPAAEEALSRLRALLAEHLTGDGVWFASSAWIVTARRPAEG